MADSAQIVHLLRRTEYVARPERVAALSALPLTAAVDSLLEFAQPRVDLPPNLDQILFRTENAQQMAFAIDWWIDRMVDSPNPLQEKMTFFWHGHFTSSFRKVERATLMARQNKLYRDNALGNFRDLTQAMAIDPAMLIYLDNAQNLMAAPNQNFARELMELFTMGIGNYTETDVVEMSRAWTGYGINRTTFTFEFHAAQHDAAAKTVFGRTAGWAGPQLIDEILLNDAQRRLISARYLVTKLWTYFAYENPSSQLVEELAQGFAADWSIKALLRAMFLRAEFYGQTAQQGMMRNPVEWVVAVLHYSGQRTAQATPRPFLTAMGQLPFDPPNVSGWRPNGYWVNTGSFTARAAFAHRVAQLMRTNHVLDNIATLSIDDAIDTAATLFGLELSSTTRSAMRGMLTTRRTTARSPREALNLLVMAMLAPEMHAV